LWGEIADWSGTNTLVRPPPDASFWLRGRQGRTGASRVKLEGISPMALTMSRLATQDKALSRMWAVSARGRLEVMKWVLKEQGRPAASDRSSVPAELLWVLDALETHFHISTATPSQSDCIDRVIQTYIDVIRVLDNSANVFVNDRTSPEAAHGTPTHVPFGSGKINFTRHFKARGRGMDGGLGSLCRAALVLREAVHIVDHPNASFSSNAVPEFQRGRYAAQTAAQQVHNPHSYAAFAQHMHFGRDTRFGAGKPNL
jgi:hypothetical protein